MILVMVALAYAFVIWFCWKWGMAGLKWLAISTLGVFAFFMVGSLVTGLTGIASANLFPVNLIITLLGFWVVELRQKPDRESA